MVVAFFFWLSRARGGITDEGMVLRSSQLNMSSVAAWWGLTTDTVFFYPVLAEDNFADDTVGEKAPSNDAIVEVVLDEEVRATYSIVPIEYVPSSEEAPTFCSISEFSGDSVNGSLVASIDERLALACPPLIDYHILGSLQLQGPRKETLDCYSKTKSDL